jgi:hypothetical protein
MTVLDVRLTEINYAINRNASSAMLVTVTLNFTSYNYNMTTLEGYVHLHVAPVNAQFQLNDGIAVS